MRSFRWLIVTAAVVIGLLIVAIAIGSIWLNSFIHSDAFKTEVEARASQTLGGPVQVQTVDFDILHGVKLQGLVTQIDPAHAGGQGALKVQVASVNCTYSLMDLLSRRLRLTGITLDQPQIVLTKQPTEPLAPSQSPADNSSASTGASSNSPTSGSSLPFQFVLDRAKVSNGVISIQDASGTSTVDLKGVNAEANTSGYYDGRDLTGTVKIASVIASGITVSDFSTPFAYHQNYISAKPFDASAFSGNIGGDFLLDGSNASVLNLNGRGFNMEQVMAAASPNATTKVTGTLDVQSKWRGAETGELKGEGDAQLSSGKLEGARMLDDVAGMLKIKELNDPVITKAQTHFVVANRAIKFIGLQVDSPGFKLTGDGVVGFNSSLDANLVLILGRDAISRMPKELSGSFVQQQDGSGSISFHVTGTTSDPKTDLPERLLMQNVQIKNVLNKALNNFFH
jgi:uncharacterized protein involved in outer membrane biogenesis